jgi:hypothetical protein
MVVAQLLLVVVIAAAFGLAATVNLLPLVGVAAAPPMVFLGDPDPAGQVRAGLAVGTIASTALLIVRRLAGR